MNEGKRIAAAPVGLCNEEVRDCRGCGALRYEHSAGWHTAHCTDRCRTLKGESNRVLRAEKTDLEVLAVPIARPAWCVGEPRKKPLR